MKPGVCCSQKDIFFSLQTYLFTMAVSIKCVNALLLVFLAVGLSQVILSNGAHDIRLEFSTSQLFTPSPISQIKILVPPKVKSER